MSCLGVLTAIPAKALNIPFWQSSRDESKLKHYRTVEEKYYKGENGLDKAWDAIFRCLNGGGLEPTNKTIEAKALMGGHNLYNDGTFDYYVNFPDDVIKIAEALECISGQDMKGRFEALDPRDYDGPHNEDDCEYTLDNFRVLKRVYKEAANDGLAVMFSVIY